MVQSSKYPYISKEMVEKFKSVIQDDDFFYFYKHVRIDTDKKVLGIFENNELKYSTAINFNDPYDCHFETEIDVSDITLEYFQKLTGEKIPRFFWEQIKPEAIRIYDQIQKEKIKQVYEIRKTIPITCFNSSPLNILMWSHYADNHNGFMIEFKIPKKDTDLLPVPITYTDEYPFIKLMSKDLENLINKKDDSLLFNLSNKILFRKARDWEYENEFRLIGIADKKKPDPLLIKFNPKYLCSVILGSRLVNSEHLKLLKMSVLNFNQKNNMDIQIYQSELIRGKYKLTVRNHPRLSEDNFKGS